MDNEYKYVVEIPSYGDVYDYCFEELKNNDNVYLIKDYIIFKSKFLKKIYQYHFTKKIRFPFRGLWNNKYYNNPFKKNDKIIFIFSTPKNNIHRYGAFEKLRKRYPNCKIVLNKNDLISESIIGKVCTENELDSFLSLYDLVTSFDYGDCEKYNFLYNPLVYSAPKVLESTNEDIDVFFCGRAKDRLELIMSTFYHFKSKGIKCIYILRDVPLDKRVNEEGLIYLDKFMSYKDNLEYVKRSKCLLEIMQDGGNGYTLRTCEAVAYNKKIITNNFVLKDAEFYNDSMISFFDKAENIDLSFINGEKIGYSNRFYFSPNKLLENITNALERD